MSKTELQNAPILLREDRPGGIVVLTLNRPAARNSLSRAMLQALEDMLADIAADASCRVVVLAGAGTVFCAGHDLREITAHRADADGGRGFYADAMAACARVMQGIVGLPQPVIAAVQGVATAAGCQLVATCDLSVAAEDARAAVVHVGHYFDDEVEQSEINAKRSVYLEEIKDAEAFNLKHLDMS
jgi:enoyl-CoA hydratase/carnithine racemase